MNRSRYLRLAYFLLLCTCVSLHPCLGSTQTATPTLLQTAPAGRQQLKAESKANSAASPDPLIQKPVWLLAASDSVSSISSFSEGLARIIYWRDQRLHYMDTTGHIINMGNDNQGEFDEGGNFHDGLAWVSKPDPADASPDGSTRLYGFINKSGQLVIPCIYDKVQDFSCRRAAVLLDGAWQYIDPSGNTVIRDDYIITKMPSVNADHEEQMTDVDPPAFHDGRLRYRDKNGLYGYRDSSGSFVIPASFNLAHSFSCGVAVVADTVPEKQMTEDDDTLTRLYNSLPSGEPEYNYRIIDRSGKLLFRLSSTTTLDMNRNFSNGLCAFLMESQDSTGWGMMTVRGQVVIPPVYRNEPMPNYDGVAFVQVDGDESSGNKDGYLVTFDNDGHIIAKIPFVTPYGAMYDSNLGFHEGLMAVQLGDYWGYIDALGHVIIKPQFGTALNFQNGLAVVKTQDGKVGVIRNPLR